MLPGNADNPSLPHSSPPQTNCLSRLPPTLDGVSNLGRQRWRSFHQLIDRLAIEDQNLQVFARPDSDLIARTSNRNLVTKALTGPNLSNLDQLAAAITRRQCGSAFDNQSETFKLFPERLNRLSCRIM
jgi:hypothetical protein